MKFLPFSLRTGLPLWCIATGFCAESPVANSAESGPSQNQPSAVLKLTAQFDRDGNRLLDADERKAARVYLADHPASVAIATGRPNPPTPQAVALEPAKPGEKIDTKGAALFANRSLYDPTTLRTLFLEFSDRDWEKELGEFARTDIHLPAQVTFDGTVYRDVGVRFRDQTPTPATSEGYKRALDLTLNHAVPGQTLGGQSHLRLLDAGTDPTLLRTALYHQVARQYGPAPKANFVRVVINGENWGIYVSVQPFDENFIKENFNTDIGSRWTVSPGGNLAYLGDKADAYRNSYRLDSPEDPAAWAALAELCKILNGTPSGELEAALASRLDIDSTLKFLALENTLINQDGYGSGTGEYGLYLASDGRFHLIPQDAEASFRLVEISEYGDRPRREAPASAPKKKKDDKNSATTDTAKTHDEQVIAKYKPKDFPKQTGTDLAMLLSYSFVNKADSDFNGKITKDEWQDFARSWFLVMDEDLVGKLTREQFIAKFRGLLTPASIADGRTKQTFGRDDPAGIIGQDLFKAMDANRDDAITSQEVSDIFSQWFAAWSNPKSSILTEAAIQRGFTTLFSRTIFQADQTYIAKRDMPVPEEDTPGGRGERGGRADGGSGLGVGPLRLGSGGRGGKGGDSRTLITFSEELDPLAGLSDASKPLLAKLLAVPALRVRYLEYMRDISENWLTWSKLGPIAKQYRDLIAADVDKETHKATSYIHFVQQFDQDTTQGSRDGDAAPSLKNFAVERSNYLLKEGGALSHIDSW